MNTPSLALSICWPVKSLKNCVLHSYHLSSCEERDRFFYFVKVMFLLHRLFLNVGFLNNKLDF
jgi:hypothetical protein